MTPRSLLLFVSIVVWSTAMYAQTPCPAGDINQHEGAWRLRQPTPATSQFRAPAGSYSRSAADATLDKVLDLLRAAYPQPRGGVAYFSKDLTFSSPYPGLPLGYSVYVGHSGFLCTAANTLAETGESGVAINVDVNSFQSAGLLSRVDAPAMNTSKGELKFNADDHGQYLIDGKRVYLIPAIAGQFRGADYYANERRTRRGDPPYEQWFIIRKPDVPMFTYVTRREYAAQFRKELEAFTARQLENDREFARLSGDPNAAAQQAAFERTMQAYMRAVDRYLVGGSEEELNRPVSEPLTVHPADPDNPEIRFRQGDFLMVHLNPDCVDSRLPHHVPQFITIRLSARGTEGTYPWELNFRNRISNGLDFEALRGLIGK